MERSFDVDRLVAALTLEEKAALCSGRDFWSTKAVERLGIPSLVLTDGPHGLRKQRSNPDRPSLHDSVPATCFPSGVLLAATWDPALVREVGQALGEESMAESVAVILGPAVNIKRSPLCGRNFEYFSEDPHLAGEIAAGHIAGVQERGVGASIKHFAVNNQEKNRMVVDAVVDERSLREIYLPAFETAVKRSRPWTVMCAYNQINGSFCSQNRLLLTEILRDEWGFDGIVMTDWGACDDRVAGIAAGQDLEMPGNGGIGDRAIVAAVKSGRLAMADLDRVVRRLLVLCQRVSESRVEGAPMGLAGHHELARRVAAEGMVLLKNSDGVLPLPESGSVALIGEFARTPRYQGGGSSHMNPAHMDTLLDSARALAPGKLRVEFAPGYRLDGDRPDDALIAEAAAAAAAADFAVVCIGLTDAYESEGFDRSHLDLPPSHLALVEAVLAAQPRSAVVLSNGSPVAMPWLDRAPAVLEAYLGGQGGGAALADLLWGRRNPCGKLAETFPRRLQDNPSYLNFPGEARRVEYREGLFVGYRHYDALDIEPLFPFGHGLSYTRFAYGPLRLDRAALGEGQTLSVSLDLTNAGGRAGKETVQLYVGQAKPRLVRPRRELKAFAKVELAPGQTKTVTFTLDRRAFAYWDDASRAWAVDPDDFEIAVGSSSRDLRSRAAVAWTGRPNCAPLHHNSLFAEALEHPAARDWAGALKTRMVASFGSYEPGSAEARMMEAMVLEFPLRNLVRMGGGLVSESELEAVIAKTRA